MCNYIQNIPEKTKFAMIIRHAEREPIKRMVNALDAPLTEKGKQDSFNLGQRLSGLSPIKLFHSPAPRCRETAEKVREGINNKSGNAENCGESWDLGAPYITGDWQIIAEKVEKIGYSKFIRLWFDNNYDDGFLMPLDRAAHIQLMIMINQLKNETVSTINITHDWNIMLLREYFFGLRHEDMDIPDFLDGVISFIKGNEIHLLYDNESRIIDLDTYKI